MKKTSHSLYLKLAAIGLALTFGLCAHAQEGARDELAHAYYLLKNANADYAGHRAKAAEEVEACAHALGMRLNERGYAPAERQWASDRQMAEARRLLSDARDHMEEQDRKHLARHLDMAINQIDTALRRR